MTDRHMLKKRLISALLSLPLVVLAVWFDQPVPWFTVLVAIVGLLAAYEFYRMGSQLRPATGLGLVWVLLFILHSHFNSGYIVPFLITSAVVLSLVWYLLRRQKEESVLTGWAWTIAGILYVGWLLSQLVALRGLDDGRNWLFFVLFVTFSSDSAAFFVGSALGKHRLALQISPGKTWEGAIGGIFGAVIIGILFTLPTPLGLPLSYGQAIAISILVSVFGQVGDLAESLLKRNLGLKDSGRLLPGHGGVLDRIDSVVFAGIIVYYFALAFNAGYLNWL